MDTNKPLAGLSVLVAGALFVGGGVAAGVGVWYVQHRQTVSADERADEALRKSAALERRTLELESDLASATAALKNAPSANDPADAEPEPQADEEPRAKDEKRIAFVVKVRRDGDALSVVADYADMLTGDEAIAAHKADGLGEIDGEQYYIRNVNPEQRTIPVAKDVKVVVWSWYAETEDVAAKSIGIAEFEKAMQGGANPDRRLYEMPYWLTIADGKVVRIEEQFIP